MRLNDEEFEALGQKIVQILPEGPRRLFHQDFVEESRLCRAEKNALAVRLANMKEHVGNALSYGGGNMSPGVAGALRAALSAAEVDGR